MKTPYAVPALALASALLGVSSFAADPSDMMSMSEASPPTSDANSGLTRAQVKAEYFKARKEGTLPQYSEATRPTTYSDSGLTRAQVKAEYFQARKEGTLPQYSEATLPTPSATSSQLTRAQVRAEYFQAMKDGTLIRNSEAGAPAINFARSSRQDPSQAMGGQRRNDMADQGLGGMAGQRQGLTDQSPEGMNNAR